MLSPSAAVPRDPSKECTPTRSASTPGPDTPSYGGMRSTSAPEELVSPSRDEKEQARLSRIRKLTPKCSDKDANDDAE